MSPELQPPTLSPETAQQLAAIKAGCATAMRDNISEGRETHVDFIISDAAVAAAEADDLSTFGARLDDLLAVPDTSLKWLASACVAGLAIGSERAYDMLDSMIQGERATMQRRIESDQNMIAREPFYEYSSGTGLANLLTACIESDSPPDAWINKAAANAAHRWVLYSEYYERVSESGTADQIAMLSPLQEKLAASLLQKEHFEGTFVRAATEKALSMTKDPALRSLLFASLLDDIKDHPFSESDKDLHWFTKALSTYIAAQEPWQPSGMYDPVIHRAHDVLALIGERVDNAGVPTEVIAIDYVTIHAALTYYSSQKPENLITSINEYVHDLLSSSSEATDFIYDVRDRVLGAHAIQEAESGNFASARTLIASIYADRRKIETLQDCYRLASKPSDLEQLHDNNLFLEPSDAPEIDRLAREGLVSDDPGRIAEILTEVARQADGNLTYHEHVYNLYTRLAAKNKDTAMQAGRQALNSFRQTDSSYLSVIRLSRALIMAGDVQETANAYAHILQGQTSRNSRIFALHRLLQILDETYPNVPAAHVDSTGNTAVSRPDDDPVMRAIIGLMGTMED